MGAGGSNKYNGVTMQRTTLIPHSQHMICHVDGHPVISRDQLPALVEYAIRHGAAWRLDNRVLEGDAPECDNCQHAEWGSRRGRGSLTWSCGLDRRDAHQCARLNLVQIAADEMDDLFAIDMTDPWIRTHWAAIVADVIHRVITPQSTPTPAHASGHSAPSPRERMDPSDDVRHHYPIMLDVAALMTDADAVGVLAANGETVRALPEVKYV